MKSLSPGLAAHLAGGVTTLCRCWRLERKDGTVMGFTDHDRDLAFDSVTYRAASGFHDMEMADHREHLLARADAGRDVPFAAGVGPKDVPLLGARAKGDDTG